MTERTTSTTIDPRAQHAAQARGLGRTLGSVEINQTRSPRSRALVAAAVLAVGVVAVVANQVSTEFVGKMQFLVLALHLCLPLGAFLLYGAWRQSQRGREQLFWCEGGMVWLAERSGETRTFAFSTMTAAVANGETSVNPGPNELRQEYLVVFKDQGKKAEIVVDDTRTLWAVNQVMNRLNLGALV